MKPHICCTQGLENLEFKLFGAVSFLMLIDRLVLSSTKDHRDLEHERHRLKSPLEAQANSQLVRSADQT
jgi:hypothetical protein